MEVPRGFPKIPFMYYRIPTPPSDYSIVFCWFYIFIPLKDVCDVFEMLVKLVSRWKARSLRSVPYCACMSELELLCVLTVRGRYVLSSSRKPKKKKNDMTFRHSVIVRTYCTLADFTTAVLCILERNPCYGNGRCPCKKQPGNHMASMRIVTRRQCRLLHPHP